MTTIFKHETAWPNNAKFYLEPPWAGGPIVYINGPGHMTKMATMHGEILQKKNFSGTGSPINLKLGMQHQRVKHYRIYINDDSG